MVAASVDSLCKAYLARRTRGASHDGVDTSEHLPGELSPVQKIVFHYLVWKRASSDAYDVSIYELLEDLRIFTEHKENIHGFPSAVVNCLLNGSQIEVTVDEEEPGMGAAVDLLLFILGLNIVSIDGIPPQRWMGEKILFKRASSN